jgi:Ran GTPase-activating protein (RanGAP) involved in mRNA processing and transport
MNQNILEENWEEYLELNGERTELNINGIIDIDVLLNIINNNTKSTSLTLNNNYFLNVEIRKLCKQLETNSTLTSLNIINNRCGDVSIIADMLKNNTTLENLSLQHNKILFFDAMDIFIALTNREKKLTSLDLSHNEISMYAMQKDGPKLMTDLKFSGIKKLSLAHNEMYEMRNINGILSCMPETLEYLDLSGNQFGNDCGGDIREYLKTNTCLKSLILNENNLMGGSAHVFQSFEKNNVLQELRMAQNSIFSMPSSIYLRRNTSLRILDLTSNRLKDQMVYIANMLCENTSLVELYCGKMTLTSHDLIYIGRALEYNKTLKILDISGDKIGENAISLFEKLVKKNTTIESFKL